MVTYISGSWIVSITLFDPGLKTRFVSAGYEGLHLVFTMVLSLPSCDDITVSPPCDRGVVGALPEDISPVQM